MSSLTASLPSFKRGCCVHEVHGAECARALTCRWLFLCSQAATRIHDDSDATYAMQTLALSQELFLVPSLAQFAVRISVLADKQGDV